MNDRVLRALLGVVVGAALAGCSGGSDSATPSGPSTPPVSTAPTSTTPATSAVPSTTEFVLPTPPSTLYEGPRVSSAGVATIVDSTGLIEVPVTSERIWALDERAALWLIELGVPVDNAADFFSDEAALSIVEAAGTPIVPAGDLELIAEAEPALIIGTGHPNNIALKPELERIAPVALPDPNTIWQEQLEIYATITGSARRAAEIIETIGRRTGDVAAEIADSEYADATVSVLAEFADGSVLTPVGNSVTATVLDDLGLDRPPSQRVSSQTTDTLVPVGTEALERTDADVTISLSGSLTNDVSVLDNPELPDTAIETTVDGTRWTLESPTSVWWIIGDLRGALFGDGAAQGDDDPTAVWEDFNVAASDQTGGAVAEVAAGAGSTLFAAYAGFAPTFDAAINGPGPVTAFMPTDAAFDEFAEAQPDLVAELQTDLELLDRLLSYHAVAAEITVADIDGPTEFETVLGEPITVDRVDGALVLNDGQARIIASDLRSDNGVVQVLSGVLIPPSMTAADT